MSQSRGKNKDILYKSQGEFYKRMEPVDLGSLIIPVDWHEIERREVINFIRNIPDKTK